MMNQTEMMASLMTATNQTVMLTVKISSLMSMKESAMMTTKS